MAAVTIASLLTVSNILFWNGTDPESKAKAKTHRQTLSEKDGDIVTMYRIFEKWLKVRESPVEDNPIEENNISEPELALLSSVTNCKALDINDKEGSDFDLIKFSDEEDIVSIVSEDLENPVIADNLPSIQHKREQRIRTKINKKEAAEWCRDNFVNGKALGLVLSSRAELLSLFKSTNIWNVKDCQIKTPSDLDLKRLVFSGYFLHTARRIQAKKSRTHQYFAIHPEVTGNLDYRAAITNHKDALTVRDFHPPDWILYDKILRISSTIFPTTSPIEDSWIKAESEEFFNLCVSKSHSLPTEMIIIRTSQECLRTIFGKYFVNLDSLERELDCSLDVDIESGIFAAYCSSTKRLILEASMNSKISDIVETMKNQVVETEYLGGTRAVIGQGYEIQEIIFPQEYTTIYIRKLPDTYTKDYLWQILTQRLNHIKKHKLIRTVEITQHETSSSAVVKFFSKLDAKAAFEALKSQNFQGQPIDVIPSGLAPKRGVSQGESSRLKISWAIARSTGKADISFSTPTDANAFINQVNYIFPGARVTGVHGEMHSSLARKPRNVVSKKPLPPTEFLKGLPKGSCPARFVVGFEQQVNHFEYKVTAVDLRPDIDEQEVFTRVKPSIPKWVRVFRATVDPIVYGEGILMDDRTKKLQPMRNYISGTMTTSDFFDKNLCRAGIYVYLVDQLKIQEAYRQVDYFALGDSFGQPHRIELEHTHATSIHIDLYNFMKNDIEEIKKIARQKGVFSTEFPPKNKSQFIQLRFRSCNAKLIREIQEKLEEISNNKKFVSQNLELLFTWTGRMRLMDLAKKTFIHWNNKTHGIWIYGRPEVQENVFKKLQVLVDQLKSLEELDKPLILDKKIIDVAKKPNDAAKISRICAQCQLDNYHFNGNRVFASGSKVAVEKLEKELEASRYLFKRRPSKLAGLSGLPDCSICFCTPEAGFMLTTICAHAFCMECIEPLFDMQPLHFPINCQDCQVPLVINDITKCAPQGKLRKFLEHAVFKYQEENATVILLCPKPGCNQLLFNGSRTSGKYGGDFYFCDECVTTYCTNCSKKLDKPVKSHEYESCEDVQNGLSDEVTVHVKYIQERIFNLSCPRCNTVFFDFTGCAAVICDTCKCGFCGICLKDCGTDSHPHVRQCSKNPRQGEYFISEAQLNQIHRSMRVLKLREYVGGIKEPKVRDDVHRAIHKDLMDLGISGNEIGF